MVSSDLKETIICRSLVYIDAIRWKLHLRAKHLASSHIKDKDIPPLPKGKSAVQVLGDFMRYLFSCARNYIIESHASGASMWKSMENNIEFILTHPNGWEGLQQQQIRHAARIAGLIPGKRKHASRIHLLTEGEASLHFCVTHMLALDSLSGKLPIVSTDELEEAEEAEEHQGIVIIDAGGGTIDLSAYSIKLSPPREFKEIAPAECKTSRDGFKFFLTYCPPRSPSRIFFRHAKSSHISQGYVAFIIPMTLKNNITSYHS
jgi:hypothetical protein